MKAKNIVKTTFKSIVIAFVILEVLLMCFVMISKMSGSSPALFGYQFYVIISPSMEPELSVGDVILAEQYTDQPIEVGDVITFLGKEGSLEGKVVTHEVIDVSEQNGELRIITKGLANNLSDPVITQHDVLSIMKYKTVVFGFIYRLLSSTPGFICLILLPLLVLMGAEIYRLAKILHSNENEDAAQQKGEADDENKDA